MLKCPRGSRSTPSEGPPVLSPGSGEGKLRPRNFHILGCFFSFTQFQTFDPTTLSVSQSFPFKESMKKTSLCGFHPITLPLFIQPLTNQPNVKWSAKAYWSFILIDGSIAVQCKVVQNAWERLMNCKRSSMQCFSVHCLVQPSACYSLWSQKDVSTLRYIAVQELAWSRVCWRQTAAAE